MKMLAETDYESMVAEKGAYFLEGLRELQRRHPIIGDVDGLGLALRMEICEPHDSFTPSKALVDRMVDEALKGDLEVDGKSYGLVLDIGGYHKNVITLAPEPAYQPGRDGLGPQAARSGFCVVSRKTERCGEPQEPCCGKRVVARSEPISGLGHRGLSPGATIVGLVQCAPGVYGRGGVGGGTPFGTREEMNLQDKRFASRSRRVSPRRPPRRVADPWPRGHADRAALRRAGSRARRATRSPASSSLDIAERPKSCVARPGRSGTRASRKPTTGCASIATSSLPAVCRWAASWRCCSRNAARRPCTACCSMRRR